MGFEIVTTDELRALAPEEYGRRVRDRVGDGPVYFSFDIDVIDPAFAPATGTPEVAGLLPHEALGYIRSLAGLEFAGFDVVEVSPPYDGPGQVTALLAANVAYEFLALTALAGR
jgi:agmatinase